MPPNIKLTEIARLRAVNAALVEALEWIATVDKNHRPLLSTHNMVAIAIDAIKQAKEREDMTTPDLNGVVTEVDDIVRDIRPLLRGHHRSVQWAVLAELVALWMIEHAAVRSRILEPLIRVHVDTVRKLVDGYIASNRDQNEKD